MECRLRLVLLLELVVEEMYDRLGGGVVYKKEMENWWASGGRLYL